MNFVVINDEFEFDTNDVIGGGTFGTVFRGRYVPEGSDSREPLSRGSSLVGYEETLVAVKRFSIGEKEANFLREAAVLERLSKIYCPNILSLLAFDHKDTYFYIVTEFCDQGNLRQLMQRQGYRIPEGTVQQIAVQSVHALAVLHDNAIIHRDLKPENILLQSNRSRLGFLVKVGDFGFSRFFGREAFAGTLCGTLMYMAPEILSKSYDEKVDYYSLGLILTELITGRSPHSREPKLSLRKPEEVLRSYEISEAFLSFQRGLLKQNPRERFSLSEIQEHPFIVGEGEVETILRTKQKSDFEVVGYELSSSDSDEESDSTSEEDQSESGIETEESDSEGEGKSGSSSEETNESEATDSSSD